MEYKAFCMLVAIKINVSYLTTSDGITYLNSRSTLGLRTGCSVLYTNSSMEEHWKLEDGSFNPEQCDNDSEARRGRPPAVLVNHSPCLHRTGLTENSWIAVSTNPLEKPMLLQNRKPLWGWQQVWHEQVMWDIKGQLHRTVPQRVSEQLYCLCMSQSWMCGL